MPFHRKIPWINALLPGIVVMAGCASFGPAGAPPLTSTPAAAFTPTGVDTATSLPTATPVVLPSVVETPTSPPAAALGLTPTSEPVVLPTLSGDAQGCMPLRADVDFPAVPKPDIYTTPDAALEYLNQGGEPARLEARLVGQVEPVVGAFHHQVTLADLTGDGIPEALLALTFSFAPTDPARGDSTLAAYRCDAGQYRMDTLFVRAGAGGRGEGLFAGGGVRVLAVQDMTGRGHQELVFGAFWDIGGDRFAEYYVGEWMGDHFGSLINYKDILDIERTSIEAGWDFEIRDIDQDRTQELIFSSSRDPRTGQAVSPAVFAWDGANYVLQTP